MSNETKIIEKLRQSTACVIGCGLGLSGDTTRILESVIQNAVCPLVIDADGLNAVAKNPSILHKAKVPVILTPHPGEMSRLTGVSIEEVKANRYRIALEFAQEYHVILVLKGAGTLTVNPRGEIAINTTGNVGLAKGGSGDVLAGVIGSLLAQGMDPYSGAVTGVYLHGEAGDIAADALSQTGMLPTDVVARLPYVFK